MIKPLLKKLFWRELPAIILGVMCVILLEYLVLWFVIFIVFDFTFGERWERYADDKVEKGN